MSTMDKQATARVWMRFCALLRAECTNGKTSKSQLICSYWDSDISVCTLSEQVKLSVDWHYRVLSKMTDEDEEDDNPDDAEEERAKGLTMPEKFMPERKPCKSLQYCPYGRLVEQFPLPGVAVAEMVEHHIKLKKMLETGNYRDEEHRKDLEAMVNSFNANDYPVEAPEVDKRLYCGVFGHKCPAFEVAEALNCRET